MSSDLLRLAASGMSPIDVAASQGWSRRRAAKAMARAAAEAAGEALDIDAARAVELAHLELLRKAIMPSALRGDVAAVRAAVRIATVKAALLGLDYELPTIVGPAAEGEPSVVDELRARRAARRAGSGPSTRG